MKFFFFKSFDTNVFFHLVPLTLNFSTSKRGVYMIIPVRTVRRLLVTLPLPTCKKILANRLSLILGFCNPGALNENIVQNHNKHSIVERI